MKSFGYQFEVKVMHGAIEAVTYHTGIASVKRHIYSAIPTEHTCNMEIAVTTYCEYTRLAGRCSVSFLFENGAFITEKEYLVLQFIKIIAKGMHQLRNPK